MRLSLFRSKSNTPSSPPSSKKTHRFGHILSPTRSKQDDSDMQASSLSPSFSAYSAIPDVPDEPSSSLAERTTQDAPKAVVSGLDAPPLPSDSAGDSSFAKEPSNNADAEQSIIDEQAMTKKLMDVESSFLPDPAPVSNGQDTNVFSGADSDLQSSRSPSYSKPFGSNWQRRGTDRTYSRATQLSPQGSNPALSSPSDRYQTSGAPAGTYARPHPFPDEDQVSYGDSSFTQPSQQRGMSSPAAEAARRNKFRGSSNYLRTSNYTDSARSAHRSPILQEAQPTGDLATGRQLSSNLRASSILTSSLNRIPEGSLKRTRESEKPDQDTSRFSGRPEHLRKHQSAQRVSKDSVGSQRSETTIGPNNDGLSGDVTPGTNARESRELSRLPSFGSLASSMSDGNELITSRGRRSNPTILPRPKNTGNLERPNDDGDEDGAKSQTQIETPRASSQTVAAPSNTVLAQHVRDVEVPDTVAREYRAAHLYGSGQKQSVDSTPLYGRGKSNLTLKEQNSKLDKLTKENFDLKLKIHFLHQALQDRSDEGVSQLMSQNAQLQADLVKAKKENQTLRRNVRSLEGRQSVQPSLEGSEDDSSRLNIRAQLEDEVMYLREQTQALQEDNARLLQGGQPEWSTLDNETVRRKQAEREVRDLQHQLEQLKANGSRLPHLRIRHSNANFGPPEAAQSLEDRDGGSLSGNTLVDQLMHENNTLRRDLGAQTDMLSSRNRERERLQQEIEELKLVQRRGEQASSLAGDSILDRSVSRNQYRSTSQASESTRDSQLSDQDRDRIESVHAGLRDENASLKMRTQDLQKELNSLGEGAEHIRSLQTERDDATQALREADGDIDYLYDQMNQLEELVLQKEQEIEALETDLRDRDEESAAFRQDLESMNDSFNALADESEANQVTLQSLRQDIANANGELEAMETNLLEAASAKARLEVQQESAEGEIAFLREEQEADKIRIGDLQSAVASAKSSLRSETSRLNEFEELEAIASKARNEARSLRKTLATRENESLALQNNFAGLQTEFGEATSEFEESKARLQESIEKLHTEAERRLQELDQASLAYDEKDRLLQDREGLLELSGHETRRLTELLDKERQGRKHDRNEYDRTLRSARGTPEARIIELESASVRERKKVAGMEQKFNEQLRSRDTLFLSFWNRLSGLCTTEKLMEPEQTPQTMESISSDLDAFDQHISTVIEAIETHFGGLRYHVFNTEKAIWNDFKSLETGLGERQARIESLEQDMQQLLMTQQTQSEQGNDYAATVEYMTRVKHENRLLRRELKFLKQGSFALPGLPSPHEGTPDRGTKHSASRDLDYADSVSMNSASSGDPLSVHKGRHRHSAAHGRSMLLRTASAGASDRTAQAAGDPEQQPSAPRPPKRSSSSLALLQDVGPISSVVSVPNSQAVRQRATADAAQPAASSQSEQRWVLKLDALKKTLYAEREGRLLDRNGARKRLEEGKRQSEALKEELKRERVKREATATAAAAVPETGTSGGEGGAVE